MEKLTIEHVVMDFSKEEGAQDLGPIISQKEFKERVEKTGGLINAVASVTNDVEDIRHVSFRQFDSDTLFSAFFAAREGSDLSQALFNALTKAK